MSKKNRNKAKNTVNVNNQEQGGKCGREDLSIRHFPAHGYDLCFCECECQDCESTCYRILMV